MPTDSDTKRNQVVILGTGTSVGVPMIGCHCNVCTSGDPRNHRTRTGVAVQTPGGTFLIDTPPELRLQLIREKIDSVEAVLFTHSHADHIFGLDDLRIIGMRRGAPVPLYCEPEVEAHIRATFSYAFHPPRNPHPGAVPRLTFRSIGLDPFCLLGVAVRPIRLWHGRLPILGFRINDVAFCTDVSRIPDESWPLLEGLDVLIIDALRERPHPTHMSLAESLEVVQRVRPRQTYFTHLSHSLDHETTNARLPDGVELAYDGLRIPC